MSGKRCRSVGKALRAGGYGCLSSGTKYRRPSPRSVRPEGWGRGGSFGDRGKGLWSSRDPPTPRRRRIPVPVPVLASENGLNVLTLVVQEPLIWVWGPGSRRDLWVGRRRPPAEPRETEVSGETGTHPSPVSCVLAGCFGRRGRRDLGSRDVGDGEGPSGGGRVEWGLLPPLGRSHRDPVSVKQESDRVLPPLLCHVPGPRYDPPLPLSPSSGSLLRPKGTWGRRGLGVGGDPGTWDGRGSEDLGWRGSRVGGGGAPRI